MIKDLNDWKKQVKEYNFQLNNLLEKNSQRKELYYGFEVFDGKPIYNPDILFIGINPGRGSGIFARDIFETEQISYLDIYDENYRNDYPNTYHLAEKTIKFFKLIDWDDEKIRGIFSSKVVKTNFYHLVTENIATLQNVLNDIQQSKPYFHKSAEFSIQLINILKPKVVILEGKTVFDNIVKECYGKNVWTNDGFGYLYDEKNGSHILGYSRARDFTNENRTYFTKKLKEII